MRYTIVSCVLGLVAICCFAAGYWQATQADQSNGYNWSELETHLASVSGDSWSVMDFKQSIAALPPSSARIFETRDTAILLELVSLYDDGFYFVPIAALVTLNVADQPAARRWAARMLVDMFSTWSGAQRKPLLEVLGPCYGRPEALSLIRTELALIDDFTKLWGALGAIEQLGLGEIIYESFDTEVLNTMPISGEAICACAAIDYQRQSNNVPRKTLLDRLDVYRRFGGTPKVVFALYADPSAVGLQDALLDVLAGAQRLDVESAVERSVAMQLIVTRAPLVRELLRAGAFRQYQDMETMAEMLLSRDAEHQDRD